MASRALFKVPEMHSPFDRRAFPVYAMIAALTLVGALLLAVRGFAVAPIVWAQFFTWPLLAILGGLGLRRIGHPNFGGAMEATGVIYWQGLSAFLCIIPLASMSAPLADWWLSDADRALGFDWVAYSKMTAGFYVVYAAAYKSLMCQPAFAAFALFLSRQPDRGWQMVMAALVTLAICSAIFPFAPAIGASEFYRFPVHTPAPPFSPVLLELKSGLRVLDAHSFQGLISFPSFHAAAAAILAWGCWTTIFRWPMLALNIIVCLSAISMGSHYLVDILAGLVASGVAIAIATRIGADGTPQRK